MPIVTVGALIADPEGRVLVVKTHKWGDRYGIPGGKIEEGETMEAAVHREIKEETGLDVFEVRFAMVQDCIDSPEFYKPAHMVLLNFTCRSEGGPVTLNDEAQSYRWVTPAEALALDLNTPTRQLLAHVRREVSHA
ncbi:MAG: NUDIX domain-containing protein [Candidatus Sericytochromatia bacterium]